MRRMDAIMPRTADGCSCWAPCARAREAAMARCSPPAAAAAPCCSSSGFGCCRSGWRWMAEDAASVGSASAEAGARRCASLLGAARGGADDDNEEEVEGGALCGQRGARVEEARRQPQQAERWLAQVEACGGSTRFDRAGSAESNKLSQQGDGTTACTGAWRRVPGSAAIVAPRAPASAACPCA